MIKTILVPTDGSDHATKAVFLASDIAEKYGARLVLMHVLKREISDAARHMAEVEHLTEAEVGAGPFAANIPAATASALHSAQVHEASQQVAQKLGERILDTAKEQAVGKGVKDVETIIDDGDPAEQILARAQVEGANLIVMGSRGLSTIKGLLIGSVSHKVSQLSKCTCMTVK